MGFENISKEDLLNEEKSIIIFNNLINSNENVIKQLKSIANVYERYDLVPSLKVINELLKNEIIDNKLTAFYNKNSSIIKNGDLNLIIENNLVELIIEAYLVKNNIEIDYNGNIEIEEKRKKAPDSVHMYLSEVSKIPLLSVEEEKN